MPTTSAANGPLPRRTAADDSLLPVVLLQVAEPPAVSQTLFSGAQLQLEAADADSEDAGSPAVEPGAAAALPGGVHTPVPAGGANPLRGTLTVRANLMDLFDQQADTPQQQKQQQPSPGPGAGAAEAPVPGPADAEAAEAGQRAGAAEVAVLAPADAEQRRYCPDP